MPPGGWGRRAAGKFDHKLEDDELFKEIGGQLDDTNFDYSQWQRSKSKVPTNRRPPPPKKHLINAFDRPLTGQREDSKSRSLPVKDQGRSSGSGLSRPCTVSSGGGTLRRSGSAPSSVCHHGAHKKKNPQDDLIEKKKTEQLKILQLRIRARKQTIEEYERRQVQLLEENMKIRTQIEREEAESHQAVKALLRKYEKFRGGIVNLNDKFGEDIAAAKFELEKTRRQIGLDILDLQGEVNKLDEELSKHQGVLHVLVNYKDKEYPVKALRISDLQKELEQLCMCNQEEEDELQHIVDSELDKLRKAQQTEQSKVTEEATQQAIELMPASLKEMATQNMVMEKDDNCSSVKGWFHQHDGFAVELEFHMAEVEELEEANALLMEQVTHLKKDPKTNIRLQMFPELFPQREKCTPDMDVILDIPTQQWLPI